MWALTIGAFLNIILDYIFIFIFKWGLFGAAIATNIGQTVGALIMFFYLLRPNQTIKFIRPHITLRIIRFTCRILRYIIALGFSVFHGEITVSIMGIAGIYTFIKYLGANGIAAFSIVYYFFPIIFMIFNATVQSAQPIIS